MPIVEWNDGFCLGIEQLDKEHKYLVDLINSFYDACARQSPIEKLDVFLQELIDYTTYHFNAEEVMMRGLEYVKYTEHRERHEFFKKTVIEMQAEFAAERKDISVATLTFLIHWLRQHILFEDADFCRLASKNLRAKKPTVS
jgi:hemerythrin